jgi:hypothetical protein
LNCFNKWTPDFIHGNDLHMLMSEQQLKGRLIIRIFIQLLWRCPAARISELPSTVMAFMEMSYRYWYLYSYFSSNNHLFYRDMGGWGFGFLHLSICTWNKKLPANIGFYTTRVHEALKIRIPWIVLINGHAKIMNFGFNGDNKLLWNTINQFNFYLIKF